MPIDFPGLGVFDQSRGWLYIVVFKRPYVSLAAFTAGRAADTIKDGVNGYTFFDFAENFFFDAVQRAVDVFRHQPDRWKQMMMAMGQDFSWSKSAEKYLEIFRRSLT